MDTHTVMKNEDGSLKTTTIVTVWTGIIQDVSPFPTNEEGQTNAKKHFATKCENATQEEIDGAYIYGRYENDDYEVIIYNT
jgi:hypothetical protein